MSKVASVSQYFTSDKTFNLDKFAQIKRDHERHKRHGLLFEEVKKLVAEGSRSITLAHILKENRNSLR